MAGAEPIQLLSIHTPSPPAKSDKWVQIQQSVIWSCGVEAGYVYKVCWKSIFGSNPVTLTMDFVRRKRMGVAAKKCRSFEVFI